MTTTQIITPEFQVGTFPAEAGPCCCGGGEPPAGDCCTDRPSTLKVTYTMGGCCAGVTLEFTATEYAHEFSETLRGWRWDDGGRAVASGYSLIALCLPSSTPPYAYWAIRLVDPSGQVSWTGSPIYTADQVDCGASTFSASFPTTPAGGGFAADCPGCGATNPSIQITITET